MLQRGGMLRRVLVVLSLAVSLNAAFLQEANWKKGESFLSFLETNDIPVSIYYNMDREDRELASEIQSNTKYQILKNDSGDVEQVLIPVGEEMQLHLIRDTKAKNFILKITPISYEEKEFSVAIDIQHSPYQDIVNATNSYALANEFISAYKKSINFKYLKKGDKLAIFYKQRIRLGKNFSNPILEAAVVEVRGKKNYVFLYGNNRYYNEKGKELEGYLLGMPLSHYKRISSRFSYKRWHPILHRYRAHLGIDYAARRGTRVKSAGSGRVSFVGRKSGYGKVIEIRHVEGYKTLYAHLSRFKRGLRRGQRVSKGQLIGYVGSTGMSTGPHLHFGLYRHNRAINPASVVRVTKNNISRKKLKKFKVLVKNYKKRFEVALADMKPPHKVKHFEYIVSLENEKKAQLTQN